MTDTSTTEVPASFSKNGAESDSVADWIKLARLPEKSATICLRADLQADFDELSAEHKRLEDNARLDARLASSVSGLQNEMARIRAEIEKSYRTFRFRALTRDEREQLNKDAPKDPDNTPEEQSTRELWVSRSAVKPRMTVEEVVALRAVIGEGQFAELWDTAYDATMRRRVDLPFMPAAWANQDPKGS